MVTPFKTDLQTDTEIMKLRLIYGRSGSGKSSFVHRLCRETRKKAPDIIVIVPDQFTHQTELELIDAYGSEGLIDTEVLSFKRLAHRLKHTYGGASVISMSSEGKEMIVRRLIESCMEKTEDSVLKSASKTDTAKDVSKIISRFRQYSVTPEMIDECELDSEKFSHTKAKLEEVNAVYKAYLALESNDYADEEDETELLIRNIYDSSFFTGKAVFIDGFDDFSRPETEVLRAILRTSDEMTLTLPVDPIMPESRKTLFARSLSMVKTVEKIFDEEAPQTEKIWLTDDFSVQPESFRLVPVERRCARGIVLIEKNIFSRPGELTPEDTDGVTITAEKNITAECAHISDEIVRLTRDKNVRYNEIAVVVPDTEKYRRYIEEAFSRRNIEFFLDAGRKIKDNPVIRFIKKLIGMASSGYDTPLVMSILSCGMLTDEEDEAFFTREELDYLNKYCTRFYIRRRDWEKPFEYGAAYYDLEKLEGSRIKVRKYIDPFIERAAKAKTAQNWCEVLEEYSDCFGLEDIIHKKSLILREKGLVDAALEYSGIINVIKDVLDQIKTFMGETTLSADDFRDVLSGSFDNMKVNIIPACIDQVSVVESGRIMAKHIKALFLAGSSEISLGDESGLFNMSELDMLRQKNIDIGADSTKKISDEEYYIYRVLSKPTDALYISYIKETDSEVANLPADAVKRVFGNALQEKAGKHYPLPIDEIDNQGDATDAMLAEKLPADEVLYSRLDEYLRENDVNGYRFLSGVRDSGRCFTLETEGMGSGVILRKSNGEYTVSISSIDGYKKCPYQYFVRYCLRPDKLRESRVKGFDVGNIIHKIMEEFSKKVLSMESPEKSDAERFIAESFDDIVRQYSDGKLSDADENKYMIDRIRRLACRMTEELIERRQRSKTKLYGTEIEFSDHPNELKSFPAIKRTVEGEQFSIMGKIDSVEYLDTDRGRFWIVNDYKTERVPEVSEIRNNTALQLPVYMSAVLNGKKDTEPGGMFYIGLNDKMKNARNELEKTENRLHRFGRNGLVLNDEELMEAIDCEDTDEKKKLRKFNNATVFDKEELDGILSSAMTDVENVFADINDGYITKIPQKDSHCKYCEYRRLCWYDPTLRNCEHRRSAFHVEDGTDEER